MQYGPTTLLVLSMPVLVNTVHLINATVGTIGYFEGQELPCHFGIEVFLVVVVISNLTIVNYFQLKIAGMAAVQRCTTPAQELETLRRVKTAVWIYLPTYIALTCAAYILDLVYLLSFDHKQIIVKSYYMSLLLTFNLLKFLLTLALCLASLGFARQLKKIVRAATRQYGEANASVRKIQITYWFIWRLVLTFFFGVVLITLMEPVVVFFLAKGDSGHLDSYTWVKTWQVVIQICQMTTVNI